MHCHYPIHLIMTKSIFFSLILTMVLTGCQQNAKQASAGYPAAEGFNMEASDSRAITIADSVMKAMGGYDAWKNTKIISWNFFGRRTHLWDKHQNRDRIEIPGQNMIIDLNIASRDGSVIHEGQSMTNPDSLDKYLQQGYEMWVNDSYWLVMPYKLKDSGVTLQYMGTDSTQDGIGSYKLKLTFDNVGVTPNNMYHVWVDSSDYLVRQWAYFPDRSSQEPRFVLPWKDYEKYGQILLSDNRGNNAISNIRVMDQWPEQAIE